MSLQRYLPTKGNISLGRMVIDITVLTIVMTGGLVFAATGIEENLYNLKKPLITARNPLLMEHMIQLNRTYGLSYYQQIIEAFNRDESKAE